MAHLKDTLSTSEKQEFDSIQKQLGLSSQGEVIKVLLASYLELQQLKNLIENDSKFNQPLAKRHSGWERSGSWAR